MEGNDVLCPHNGNSARRLGFRTFASCRSAETPVENSPEASTVEKQRGTKPALVSGTIAMGDLLQTDLGRGSGPWKSRKPQRPIARFLFGGSCIRGRISNRCRRARLRRQMVGGPRSPVCLHVNRSWFPGLVRFEAPGNQNLLRRPDHFRIAGKKDLALRRIELDPAQGLDGALCQQVLNSSCLTPKMRVFVWSRD